MILVLILSSFAVTPMKMLQKCFCHVKYFVYVFSASDWKYAAEQFVKKLPDKVFVHRESSLVVSPLHVHLKIIYNLSRYLIFPIRIIFYEFAILSSFWCCFVLTLVSF